MQTPPREATSHVGAPQPEIDARRAATHLRNLLRLNSVFSLATGSIGLLAAGRVAELLGVEQIWAIRILGAGLIGFAAAVFAVSGARTQLLR